MYKYMIVIYCPNKMSNTGKTIIPTIVGQIAKRQSPDV